MYIQIIILKKLKNQLLMLKTEFIKTNLTAVELLVKKISFLQEYRDLKKWGNFNG